MPDYDWLYPYTTSDRHREILKALREAPTVEEASKRLGVTMRNVYAQIGRLRAKAEASGAKPHIPPGHKLIGQSTLTKTEDGEPQWIKTKLDGEAEIERIKEMRAAFTESIGREKAVAKPKKQNADLMNLYILTDFHLGMYSWKEETGNDWDARIAENMLVDWIAHSIRNAPPADTAVFAQLGDFLHFDGLEAVTPTSAHSLDADTRFAKMVRIAIRSCRRIIRELLTKHQAVHVLMAEGNHDIASSAWLRETFWAFYEDEPRVTVDRSPNPFYCYEFGKTSLFFHHGHKRKPNNVDDVFAAQYREIFGRTSHSYAHLGHMHHDKVFETNLMRVEQHRTLAARDAYSAFGGWYSGRSAPVITYHKEYGEVGRINITPEML